MILALALLATIFYINQDAIGLLVHLGNATKSIIWSPFENNFCYFHNIAVIFHVSYLYNIFLFLINLICPMQTTFFQCIRMKYITFEVHITEYHHHYHLNIVFLKYFFSYRSLGLIIRWVGLFTIIFTSKRWMHWTMCRCHQPGKWCQKSQGDKCWNNSYFLFPG